MILALAFFRANIWKYIPKEKKIPIGKKKNNDFKYTGSQKKKVIIEVTHIPTKEEQNKDTSGVSYSVIFFVAI